MYLQPRTNICPICKKNKGNKSHPECSRKMQQIAIEQTHKKKKEKSLTIKIDRLNDPEKYRLATKKWADKNKDKINLKAKRYREKNPDKCKAYIKNWANANKEKLKINSLNRRAKKLTNGGKLSKGLFEKLIILQKNKCITCKKELVDKKIHMDHIVPLSLGGTNTDNNIQLLCEFCNCSKGAKDPIVFMQSIGFLI